MNFRWLGKSENGEEIVLKKLKGCPVSVAPYATEDWLARNSDIVKTAVVVDVETTGLDFKKDVIIEIAVLPFLFHKETHEVLKILQPYTAFQDPKIKLTDEIKQLTGLTDEMLAGQSIAWSTVNQILDTAEVVIAHNARFDRAFVDNKSSTSLEKVWACSFKQIAWSSFGFNTAKLESLNIYHGFFTDSHRALNDVEALLYLISHTINEEENSTYLSQLLKNAQTPSVQVIASSSPFSTKDLLKSRSYSWDNQNRFWHKSIPRPELAHEMKWLEENVYLGSFAGMVREIAINDTFKF